MRAPWLQIEMELLEVVAPELAVELGRDDYSEADAFLGLVRVIAMFLSRCRDEAPPSAQAFLTGPKAAERIAREAGYPGPAEEFVAAACRVAYAPLARIDGGIRMRGIRRYDALWISNNRKRAKAYKDAHPDWRTPVDEEPPGEPRGARAGTHAPDPDQDPDPDSYLPPPPPNPPPPPELARSVRDPKAVAAAVNTYWDALQAQRAEFGLTHEDKLRKKGLAKFTAWVLNEASRHGLPAILASHRVYLGDWKIEAKEHPTNVFIAEGVWDSRLPPREPDLPPPITCAVCPKPATHEITPEIQLCDLDDLAWFAFVQEGGTKVDFNAGLQQFIEERKPRGEAA